MAFVDNRIQVKAALKNEGVAFLHEAAGEVQAQTKRNTKVVTSETKGSWKYVVDESKLEAVIGSDSENAIWEEFGTGEYALNGDGRKGGWSYKDEEGVWHHTHGKKPRRAFYKAFTSLKGKIIKEAQARFKGM